jgi:hypothetical protein
MGPYSAIPRRTSCARSRYRASCARLHASILESILFAPLAKSMDGQVQAKHRMCESLPRANKF